MSGGAKRSSLNQTLNEIQIDSFWDIRIDGWIYLSIHIYVARSPKSLIWPGNKALLWAEGNELGCFSSTLLDFLLRARSACASRAIGALLSSYFSSLDGSVRMDFAVLSQLKWKKKGCITSRCRFVLCPKWDGELVTSVPSSFWIEARPGSRRSNNRRGAPQYTIARSNWESYYT